MARISPLMLIPVVVFTGLVGLAAGAMYSRDGDELPSALIGKPAPALPQEPVPGFPGIDPNILADGEVKLVNFFASWCAPCRVEHPHLTALAQEGIPIYGVAYKDQPRNTAAFLEELGNPYAGIAQDFDGRVAPDWGLYGVPETFVVAGDGTIVARMANPVTPDVVESRLRPALAEAEALGD